VGSSKVASAQARLADLNPHVTLEPYPFRLTSHNALDVLKSYDVIVDGSDNFPTRYLVNDACVLLGKPLVYGSIFRFEGQVSVFDARSGPCYRCLYAEPPPPGLVPSCAESGVLGVLPGVIGSLQALEALKLVLGQGETLLGRLLLFDALRLRFRELTLRKDPECPVCGTNPTLTTLIDYDAFCGVTPTAENAGSEVEASALLAEIESGKPITLIDVREPHEWEIVRLPDARLIPLGQLPARLGELDPRSDIVTLCHHGLRSAQAREILLGAGFPRVRSLRGGIDGWATEAAPGMVRY
jgi:adenylyltransferase/sulfurtransferase